MKTVLDFYSGVGGWSIGFRLAGIKVQESFEWWTTALDTYNCNFGLSTSPADIRKLDIKSLPDRADYIVGSPPCTQFSYSNRGGRGDIEDGLVDIRRFLDIVERLKPRCWAMENVPRVAQILTAELKPGGSLSRYAKLFSVITVVKMEEFGLPQRRRRMLAGNFDEQLLMSYRDGQPTRTLGGVVKALSSELVRDPIYGIELPRDTVSGLEREAPLSAEEARMNREAKEYHPIYNVMAFPDPLGKPSRTVTATCTRVSRESIVIADPRKSKAVRRLSVRERASLQGFPITYEFHGDSHSDRLKMVGNAIPPVMTYFLAHCFRGTRPGKIPAFETLEARLPKPKQKASPMAPDKVGSRYSKTRKFQAALPGLRFGSGMRFELSNASDGDGMRWDVRFFFGASKKYRQIELDRRVIDQIKKHSSWSSLSESFRQSSEIVDHVLSRTESALLQAVWTRKAEGMTPYEVVDELGRAADLIVKAAADLKQVWIANLVAQLATGGQSETLSAVSKKFYQYDSRVLAGLLVGAYFNVACSQQREQSPPLKRQAPG